MRVHIAQPALSTQIQALERELGGQLFVRTTRRVELTVAGETFYDRCVRILSDRNASTEVTRSVAGKTARKIRIGTICPDKVRPPRQPATALSGASAAATASGNAGNH